ncbi:RagB/SusD family nutrient uptake outer membrane protein [Bacteroides sedimenti]|uniref:RagB/SusD family nutrient uptake outer membrane protein n=1 Tax=Bacteroides sedimenti TaxID=2136147 RepID=A0ABN6ZBC8_9BACE
MKFLDKKGIYVCALGLLTLTTACTDWLEPKPLSFFTPENSFNSYGGLKTATDMLNRDVRYIDYYPTGFSAPPAFLTELVFSDVAVNGMTDTNNPPQDLNRQITPSANLSTAANAGRSGFYWDSMYKGIKDANTIISRSKTATFDSEEQRKEVEGLAYFHRAYRYYRLVHQFGDVPLITEEITEPRYNFYTTKREVILRMMKEDLERTAPYLKKEVNKGMVSQAAAYHLLAKIDLALGEFDAAIDATSKVINDGVHSLMTERFGIDKNDATKNVIWDLHRSENKALPANKEVLYMVLDRFGPEGGSATGLEIKRQVLPMYSATNNLLTPDGFAGFVDNDEVKNPYLKQYGRGICTLRSTWYHTHMIWTLDNTDLRHAKGNWMEMSDLNYNNPSLKGKSQWYGKPVQLTDAKGKYLCKDTIRAWVGWPHYKVYVPDDTEANWRGGHADWYIFRLAETYLLRAEAYYWKGMKEEAAADLNKIRARAQARPLTASEVTMKTILDERARELFYEEPRKTELTRIAYIYAQTGKVADNGKTYSLDKFSENNFFFDQISKYSDFYNKGVKTAKGNEYTMSPYHVLWPIPIDAIKVNVQGHINQNKGYSGSEDNITPLDHSN